MALVNWHNAATHPPTEPGWYPTKIDYCTIAVWMRWWDGVRFSLGVPKHSGVAYVTQASRMKAHARPARIFWSPDFFTWEDVA